MKKVFNNTADVIHLFAQQTQTEANSSNVFMKKSWTFKQDYANELYSYGHHYLLAEFRTNKNGEEYVYINNSGYSNTTAKHISIVIGATRQYTQFFEDAINIDKVLSRIKIAFDKLTKAKKPEIYINSINNDFESYVKYIEFSGYAKAAQKESSYKECLKIVSAVNSEDLKAKLEKRASQIKADQKRELKKREAWNKKQVTDFMTYETNYVSLENEVLRISKCGQFVETSQNVSIPVQSAKALYTLIKEGRDIKGYKIENYTVISINGVLSIGCHKIDMKSVKSIGEKIIKINI